MAQFEGKNNLGTAELFFQRLSYSQLAFPQTSTSLYIHPVRDFNFAEYMLYGRINKNHNPIVFNTANSKKITNLNDPKQDLVAANFVVDAFNAVVQEFEKAALQGKLATDDSYLYQIKAYRAYDSLGAFYNNYRNGLEDVFFSNFLTDKRNKQILNFKTFLPIFLEYVNQVSVASAVTQTGFVTTQFCPPTSSGLVISISDLDPTNDEDKEKFITSPNFLYYVEVLKKHGFFISKDRPWELVADIANPFMLNYAATYNLANESDVLRVYFQRSGGSDIADLKRLALSFYNRIALTKTFVRTRIKNVKSRVCRKPYTLQQMNEEYSDNYWLDKYVDIRYYEQQQPISQGDLISLKKDLPSLLTVRGLNFVLSHVNNKLNGFANYDGSFAKIALKQESRRTGTPLDPTY